MHIKVGNINDETLSQRPNQAQVGWLNIEQLHEQVAKSVHFHLILESRFTNKKMYQIKYVEFKRSDFCFQAHGWNLNIGSL